MLKIENIHAGYGRLAVVHGIGFDVSSAEVVGITGPNGAGKSTLLRAISGLLPTTAGSTVVDGRDVTALRAETIAGAGLSHVPENRLIFPTLTVDDNLTLGGWLRRREDRTETEARRARLLELFPNLRDRLAQQAGTMSGGEQQMLAVARGLMASPKVLILDEPSLGLAPLVTREIFSALARLRDEDGLAILLVEQNVRALLKFADRVLVMERGRSKFLGSPSQVSASGLLEDTYLGSVATSR